MTNLTGKTFRIIEAYQCLWCPEVRETEDKINLHVGFAHPEELPR